MKLTISNIGPIEHYEETFRPGYVTVVAADNQAGKSTIASCLAACLSRTRDPQKRGGNRLGAYVRRGADSAQSFARLEDDDGDWEITWEPIRGFTTRGDNPPKAPLLAVLDPSERGKEDWLEAIVADPITHEYLTDEIVKVMGKANREAAEEAATEILQDEPHSWQVYEGKVQEKRAEAKRDWQNAVASTGEHATYGPSVATAWAPRGWMAEYESLTPATCERRVADAKRDFESASSALAALRNMADEHSEYVQRKQAHDRRMTDLRNQQSALNRVQFPDAPGDDELEQANEHLESITGQCNAHSDFYAEKRATQSREKAKLQDILDSEVRIKRDHQKLVDEHERKIKALEREKDKISEQIDKLICDPTLDDNYCCPTCDRLWQAAVRSTQQLLANLQEIHKKKCLEIVRATDDSPPDFPDLGGILQEISNQRGVVEIADQAYFDHRAENRKLESDVHDASVRVGKLKRQQVEAAEGRSAHESKVARVNGQIEELERIEFEEPDLPNDADLEAAKVVRDRASDDVTSATRQHTIVKAKQNAWAAHERVVMWDAMSRLVSTTAHGVRAKKLKDKIVEVNNWLVQIAPWSGVGINNSPSLTVKGSLLADACASEQWMAKTALRLTVGCMRHAPAVVVDGIDILSSTHRYSAIETIQEMAREQGIAVLVTETVAGESIYV